MRKISFGQRKRYKKCTLFFFRETNSSQFYFGFTILIQSEAHKFHLSKTVRGIFHFRFRLIFIKVYIFVQQKTWPLWLQNVIINFKIEMIEKLLWFLSLWFLSFNKTFESSIISALGLPKNWPEDEMFKLLNRSFELFTFSQ